MVDSGQMDLTGDLMNIPTPHISVIGKVLRLPLRMIPSGTQMPILRGPMRGKRWIVGASNHGCWLGTYERSMQKMFLTTIKRGDVVYDLGANVGFYSLLASVLVGSDGQVFSFEPAPRNLEFIRRHLELNRVKNCSVFDVAVSNSNGTARFDFGLHPHLGHLGGDSENAARMRTVTLDSLVASGQIKPPNFIKCDIEGAEFDALTGAAGILSKYAPVILLATHGPKVHQDCCSLLADIGYQLTPLDYPSLHKASEILAVRRT